MKQEKNEVFDIRNYLVQNNYQKGLSAILDDYFTNKANYYITFGGLTWIT